MLEKLGLLLGIFGRIEAFSKHRFQVQGSGFKGYNRWTLLTLLIKIRNTRHTPWGETAF
jgi:hypothetical protein